MFKINPKDMTGNVKVILDQITAIENTITLLALTQGVNSEKGRSMLAKRHELKEKLKKQVWFNNEIGKK